MPMLDQSGGVEAGLTDVGRGVGRMCWPDATPKEGVDILLQATEQVATLSGETARDCSYSCIEAYWIATGCHSPLYLHGPDHS